MATKWSMILEPAFPNSNFDYEHRLDRLILGYSDLNPHFEFLNSYNLSSCAQYLYQGYVSSLSGGAFEFSPYPYTIYVYHPSGIETALSAPERFVLVSSLYGAGNCISWFLILLSVTISWSSSTAARGPPRDSITNDFVAAVSMPLVAVGHYLHQVMTMRPGPGYQYPLPAGGGSGSDASRFKTAVTPEQVRFMAAIEAPLTVCEDFIPWAALLYLLAARRRCVRRMTAVLVVGVLCVLLQGLHAAVVEMGYRDEDHDLNLSSLLVRPFLFHVLPVYNVFCFWSLLTAVVYAFEIFDLNRTAGRTTAGDDGDEVEVDEASGKKESTAGRAALWPGRLSGWMSGCEAVVVAATSVIIKYGPFYPGDLRFQDFRFIPRSNVSITELDQVVAMLGGLITLIFTLLGVFKGWRAARAGN